MQRRPHDAGQDHPDHRIRWPRSDEARRAARGRPRPRRDPHPPPCLRAELHRRVPAHGAVQEPAAADDGHGSGRRGRGGGRGCVAPEDGRPRGLCQQPAGLVQPGACHAGEDGVPPARCHRLRHRRGDDAQGPDGAVPAEAHAAARRAAGRRLRALPCRRRRRGPDRLPVGQGAGAATDRHRGQRCQVPAGAGAWRGTCHQLQHGRLRRARQGRSPAARA